MTDSLFPLPLTLWEELFVIDDYEAYPANFMTRIRCRGTVSPELFHEALRNCEAAHPLFRCLVVQQKRVYRWEPCPESTLPIEFVKSSQEQEMPPQRKFDLFSGRLWRIQLHEFPDETGQLRTDIFVEIHHSLCDGLGAIQFVSDVAKQIQGLYADPQTALRPEVDFVALRERGRFRQTWKEVFKGLRHQYKSLLTTFRLIFTRVDSLVPIPSIKELFETPKQRLGYHKIVLSPTVSSQLRRICRKEDTTVNSRVTAELFRSIYDWKIAQGHAAPKALRVMMPFNERGLSDRHLPACNKVSLSPLTRSRKQILNPTKLLESVENAVRLVKKVRLGLNFHRGLWFCKTFFRSLKMLAKTDRVGATCVFANVGNIHAHLGLPYEGNLTQCGPLAIEDIDLVPTIRIGTSFAMTLHEFNGGTRLGVHYDSNLLSEELATNFFTYLQERIIRMTDKS